MKKFKLMAGFTMIELLVVIAVIGILAVAVLSSINPIEQINKGRDTRTRTDASQLIGAVDRYFANQEYYPWNYTTDTYTPAESADEYDDEYSFIGTDNPDAPEGFAAVDSDWDWIDDLETTAEIKSGYVRRLKTDNNLLVYKEGGAQGTIIVCFSPTSQAFKREAAEKCQTGEAAASLGEGATSITICPNGTDAVTEDNNWICMP